MLALQTDPATWQFFDNRGLNPPRTTPFCAGLVCTVFSDDTAIRQVCEIDTALESETCELYIYPVQYSAIYV